MPNIKLHYLYRDYANYKNYHEVVFSNPDNLSAVLIDTALRAVCMDNEYFLASRWGLPDLHFEKYDDENDHPWHTYQQVELTDNPVTESISVTEFLQRVKGTSPIP